jgi:NADPH:quinone reductase-like Zn-dependent oxidoreductase
MANLPMCFGEGAALRYDVLADFARLAVQGRFEVPVSGTFALSDWRAALEVSESGKARGKLLLLPDHPSPSD